MAPRQAPIPETPNVAEWERLRADYLCEEMAPTKENARGLTPAEAAQYANARTINAWRVRFPGRSLPLQVVEPATSKRTGETPGGIETSDGRNWMIAARVEDDRSSFAPDERISHGELADIARSYDPDLIHQAPVGTPNGGPGHWTLEFADKMAGQVDAIDFDGYNLWTLVSQNDGMVRKAIKAGLRSRSIGVMPNYSEAGGKPYLRHLLITAETPGITNLRPLETFFPAGKGESRAATPTRWRTINDLPTAERSITMPEKKEATELDLDALAGKIGDKVSEAVGAAIARALPAKKDEPAPKTDTSAGLTADQVRALINEAQKPLADQNAELKTQLETMRTERAAAEQAATKRAKTEQDALVRSALDEAVVTGRMLPAERGLLERSLLHETAAAEVVTATLDEVKKRTPKSVRPQLSATVRSGDEDIQVDEDLRDLVSRGEADPAMARQAALIRSRVAKLPEKERAAATQREWTNFYSAAQEAASA